MVLRGPLTHPGVSESQLLTGLRELPVPLADSALVISDNGDIYGTVADLYSRASELTE